MTAEPRPPVILPSLPQRLVGFLARRWAWLLLVAAVLIFAFRFVPSLTFSLLDTETVMLPLVYQDIVTEHHPAANWQWPGANSMFPDVIVFFLLRFLGRNDWFALEGMAVFFFLALVAACAGLAFASRRPHALGLVTLLVLLVFSQACDFAPGSPTGILIRDALFQPIYHSGTALFCVAGFALLLAQILGAGRMGLWWLFVLTFAAAVSDFLFLVDFVLPAVLTSGVLAFAFRREWKRHLRLGAGVGLAGCAAFFLAPYCFPAPTTTGDYLIFNPTGMRLSLGVFWSEFKDADNHFFVFLIALDVVTLLAGLAVLIALFFKGGRKIPAPVLAAMVFSSCVVGCDWGATLLNGGYASMAENRYLAAALLTPLFLFAFGLHAVIAWRPWLERGVAAAAAVFIAVCAFIPQEPIGAYPGTLQLIPILQDVMKKNHITAGLITYWRANLITFLSQGTVTLRAETPDGDVVRSGGTMTWYGKGSPVEDAPHFRLIFPEYPSQTRLQFGPPDQVLTLPDGETIWIYSEAHSIIYNEYFELLSNRWTDHGHTLNFNAVDLPSHTGRTLGTSRIAAPGDSDDHLTYGPYLSLKPGHYRATYRYQYLAPPDPDHVAAYDLFVQHPNGESFLTVPLAYVDNQPRILTDDFTVHQPGLLYEMRIRYHGSGAIRVDSLSVTVLGP
jgi:hypothetical protein